MSRPDSPSNELGHVSERDASRPVTPTPTNAAEVRSQAVAMLKRAASLPRRGDSRRPSQSSGSHAMPNIMLGAPISTASMEAGPSSSFGHAESSQHAEQQEMLSPSPVDRQFDRANIEYPAYGGSGFGMQRSISASSSFQSHTPIRGVGAQGSPFAGDWSSGQMAQQYSQQSLTPLHGSMGRNTPSPLPSLGDLRLLQRSNSQMARARAMEKLTGGRDTPDTDRPILSQSVGTGLQRAGTVGASRLPGFLANRAIPQVAPAPDPFAPASDLALPRPRLQRSFTVSSSNMGEERRSAVGRRMVERLAERRAAREKEEAEVRQLWEERRAAAELDRPVSTGSQLDQEANVDSYYQQYEDDQGEEEKLDEVVPDVPVVMRSSPTDPPHSDDTHHLHPPNSLQVPDRSPSRSTTVSVDEAFEYESHLRRSLSGRTARGPEAIPVTASQPAEHPVATARHQSEAMPQSGFAQVHEYADDPAYAEGDDWDPEPPRPAFATPTRRMPSSGALRERGAKGSSPGTDSIVSRDGFGSMMFVVDKRGSEETPAMPTSDMPVGVEEGGGSEWGTPKKQVPASQQTVRADAPGTPEGYDQSQEDEATPPGPGRRSSTMSWEEVGGEDDREVPSDQRYLRKSSSISARIGRTVKTVMRKRSQSRMSASSSVASPPPSPGKGLAWRRRGSETSGVSGHGMDQSLAPVSASSRDGTKHASAVSTSTASEGGHMQFLGEQVSDNFPPVAPPNDPRLLSAKLSPFPGMASLEGGSRLFEGQMSNPPPLLQQNSDSVVPTQQRVAQPASSDIYSLPLPANTDDKRGSADSLGKRSWLAKAFGTATSPRSSGGTATSRRPSSVEPSAPSRKQSVDAQGQIDEGDEADPDSFAAPAAPGLSFGALPARMRARPASPTVSVVPEGSEDGSRFTRFTTHREWTEQDPDQIIHEQEYEDRHPAEGSPQQSVAQGLSQKSAEVLMRMDHLLSMSPEDTRRPDILDDPPRKLLLSTQVLQVVNVNTAKDRFLFLFNDILVITKPIIISGTTATLDMRFVVKSVVSLDKLQASGFSDTSTREPERDVLVAEFIERFSRDPQAACRFLVERNRWKDDLANLAAVIFKTAELDKAMIGSLLADQQGLMQAFLDQFQFANMRLDDALRTFLLSLRLPDAPVRSEALLRGFAFRWHEANKATVPYSPDLVFDLVLAIMQLNDAMHGGAFGFAMHNAALSPDLFISSFRSKDPRGLVSNAILVDIYESISHTQLSQALASDHARTLRPVTMRPERLPAKLTYGKWSEPIEISLPGPDADFAVQLRGEGLEFDVPLLEFKRDATASFRVRGTGLGTKSILFNRGGTNACLYGTLGNASVVNVERAFMKHTFHVAFANHLGVKRKYCFSISDPALRAKWGSVLHRQIAHTRQIRSTPPTSTREQIRRTAESVALQVLRDALIPHVTTESEVGAGPSKPKQERSGSVSIAYQQVAEGDEKGLGPLVPPQKGNASEGLDGMVECQSGKEVVLVCRQNSLLPGVLELLQAGMEPQVGRPGMV